MFPLPPSSAATLKDVPWPSATAVAAECKSLYDAYDKAAGSRDPSRCQAILRFPCGTVFWSSKLAIDADGLGGVRLDPADGQNDTTFHFPAGGPLESERHPFLVLPGGAFRAQTGLKIGDVAVLIYGNRITAALCGDIGPEHKIGEASIRVHEAFVPTAPDPCIRNPDGACRRIHDVSIPADVLTFAFPDSAIGAELTPDNAEALIKARAYALFARLQGRPTP